MVTQLEYLSACLKLRLSLVESALGHPLDTFCIEWVDDAFRYVWVQVMTLLFYFRYGDLWTCPSCCALKRAWEPCRLMFQSSSMWSALLSTHTSEPASVKLKFKLHEWPLTCISSRRIPDIRLENAVGLPKQLMLVLLGEVKELAKSLKGEVGCQSFYCLVSIDWFMLWIAAFQVMILDLCQHIQGFLHTHNRPPPSSFYEQMLQNKQRQDEVVQQEIDKHQEMLRQKEERQVTWHWTSVCIPWYGSH